MSVLPLAYWTIKERVNLRDSVKTPLKDYIVLCVPYILRFIDYHRTAPHGIGRFITFYYELILSYKRGL